MRKGLVILWLVATVVAVVLSVHQALGATLAPGENVTVTLNCSNSTAFFNETYWCSDAACVYNGSWSWAANLTAGESATWSEGACSAAVQCAEPDGDVNASRACVIDTRIDPGTSYERVAGACNVQVECREDSCDWELGNVTHRRSIDIEVDPLHGDLTIDLEGKNPLVFSLEEGKQVYSGVYEFACPVVEPEEDNLSVEDAYRYCADMLPTLTGWYDTAKGQESDCASRLLECELAKNSEVRAERDRANDLEAQLSSSEASRRTKQEDYEDCLAREVQSETWFVALWVAVLLLAVLAGGLGLVAGFLLWQVGKLKRRGVGE